SRSDDASHLRSATGATWQVLASFQEYQLVFLATGRLYLLHCVSPEWPTCESVADGINFGCLRNCGRDLLDATFRIVTHSSTRHFGIQRGDCALLAFARC